MVSQKFYLLVINMITCVSSSNSCAYSDSAKIKDNLYSVQDTWPDKKPIRIGVLYTLASLTNWAWKEEDMTMVLKERLEILEQEQQLIKSYLEDYKKTSGDALANLIEPKATPEERGKVIGSSAVLSHAMTHRYTSTIHRLRRLWKSPKFIENKDDIQTVFDIPENASNSSVYIPRLSLEEFYLNQSNSNQTVSEVEVNQPEIKIASIKTPWPSWQDKYMSLNSFTRTMEVYGFPPAGMRHGLTLDTNFGASLNAEQCAELGMFALYQGHYYMAVDWLEVAKSVLVEEDDRPSIPIELLSSLLDVAIQEHNIGHTLHRKDKLYEDYFLNSTYEGQNRNMRLRGRSGLFQHLTGMGPKAHPRFQYYGLCFGHTYQTPAIQKTLKCYYENKRHPYLYINPVKTEVLSESPPIFQFYEMIGNKTIEQIKEWTVPYMQLSQIVGKDTLQDITRYRTSFGASLDYYRLPKLYELGEIITGLKIIGTSEFSQVAEYVYGRYYAVHTDALEEAEQASDTVALSGDRLATLLYYMETGELGGKTPFCQAGVSAHQVRGSAILWFNLHRNGTTRQDATHGACPVLHGSKMIINHWIRSMGNWNTYKCSLNQFE